MTRTELLEASPILLEVHNFIIEDSSASNGDVKLKMGNIYETMNRAKRQLRLVSTMSTLDIEGFMKLLVCLGNHSSTDLFTQTGYYVNTE